jgi:hypothetical protein
MNQALYAHMNNKRKMKKKNTMLQLSRKENMKNTCQKTKKFTKNFCAIAYFCQVCGHFHLVIMIL